MSAKPYIQQNYHIESSPKNAYVGHDSLGIALNPGTFHIKHNNKHSFSTKHTVKKQRKVVHFKDENSLNTSVGFFGCSFTYGYGVNDNQHFVSLLQKEHPNIKMTNYGVIGYGTTQPLLQLKELQRLNQLPDLVILTFATDHFERNALTNQFRRSLKIGFDNSLETAKVTMKYAKFPYLNHPNESISFEAWDNLYEDWRGRSLFATVNFIQTKKDNILDNKRDLVGISLTLINKMRDICTNNKSDFLVVLLDENERSLTLRNHLELSKISFIEVGFDFESTTYTNLPYDMHPNASGHEYIAQKIMPTFKTFVSSE